MKPEDHSFSFGLNPFTDGLEAAGNDVMLALALHHGDESDQHFRRSFVRTGFAFTESSISAVRAIGLQMHELAEEAANHLPDGTRPKQLSPHEHLLLQDRQFIIGPNGRPKEIDYFASTGPRLLFALRTLASLFEREDLVDTGSHQWGEFKMSIKLRDRLTHPKTIDDLVVSDDDMAMVIRSMEWSRSVAAGLMGAGIDHLERLGGNAGI